MIMQCFTNMRSKISLHELGKEYKDIYEKKRKRS